MIWFEHPSVCAHKQAFVHLHAPVVLLPVQRDNLRAAPPKFGRIEVCGSDSSSFGKDAAHVVGRVMNEGGERGREMKDVAVGAIMLSVLVGFVVLFD